jgi:Tfp pilus assembly protein PilX
MSSQTRGERGSVLIVAVIAMLVLSILGVSFALLSKIETSIGFNYKQQAQAEALAEAGLDRARDAMRTAIDTTDGFTTWLGNLWGGAAQTPAAFSGNSAYWYRVKVENDCGAPLVPESIKEASGVSCDQTTDRNETVVVTSWAEAGSGRARVRAIVAVDNAWKHVCSAHVADSGGLCNNDDNTNGNPSIQPADPNDPNGPAAWDGLPRPYLGCSQIDPLVHKRPADTTGALQAAACATPGPYTYPYPAHSASAEPRFVVMAQDPNAVGASATTPYCGTNATTGFKYFGYFDCALSTPCPAAVCGESGGVLNRKGCVQATDPRVTSDPNSYQAAPCGAHTGMVFVGNQDFGDIGSQAQGYTIYVLDGTVQIQDNTVYGTIVVEGDSSNTTCPSNKDVQLKTRGIVWTGPNTTDTTGWTMPRQYGYPLAFLVYDPELADPTSSGTPQGTCSDFGSSGGGPTERAQIHGLVFSGGQVEFNPLVMDGGVVAWEIQTQATDSNYAYNYTYGESVPPPGFPKSGGTEVKIVRKSFIVCSNYLANASNAACN